MSKQTDEGHAWKRTSTRIFFGHQDMDFYFRWLLGVQSHGGSEAGECYYAASRISDGDPVSWTVEWAELAERVEARASAALAGGHVVSAREAFFRAATYHRAPLTFTSPRSPDFAARRERARGCFRKAASLAEHVIQPIEVPFEGARLPGYFLAPDGGGGPRKTLIMIGGGETFVEDLYFYVGPAGVKRGYNVIIVDLPGQGDLVLQGVYFRPDPETPISRVVDYALGREEVDAGRLALYGISGGGFFVTRAATVERRIKACVGNPPYYDADRVAAANAAAMPGGADAISKLFFEQLLWRAGVFALSPAELEEAKRKAAPLRRCDPRQIACPMLCLADAGELPEWIAQTKEIHDMLPNPRKALHITTADEGVEGHCHLNNLSLMSQLVFDWLDDVL